MLDNLDLMSASYLDPQTGLVGLNSIVQDVAGLHNGPVALRVFRPVSISKFPIRANDRRT
ncbi:hypothetical protein JCM9803A_02200 [Rhodococcus erythropolis]